MEGASRGGACKRADDDYAASTWFYNQMRDVSLFQFAEALQARMRPLLTLQTNTSLSATAI